MLEEMLIEAFAVLFVIVYAVALPGALTIWNVYNLFAGKKRHLKIALLLTMGVGLLDYTLLYHLLWNTAGDYSVVINTLQVHYSIASEYCLSFALPVILGFLGLLVLGLVSGEKLPPMVSAAAAACVVLGNVLGCIFAVQIWSSDKFPGIFWLYLFHFNMLVLSVTHIHKMMKEHIEIFHERKTVFRHGWMGKLYPFICSISRMRMFYFFILFPVAGVLEIILILFGQGPDGVAKAFTMTADWNFSRQIPPPPVAYEGHYLCTVAAGGHAGLVKPMRYGMRRGERIVVNRQLCVANAFEELLQERASHLHKKIRCFYDTHGYPLSRLITTPARADLVYLLMKPLEWIFLGVLYLLDTHPEQRIAEQYREE